MSPVDHPKDIAGKFCGACESKKTTRNLKTLDEDEAGEENMAALFGAGLSSSHDRVVPAQPHQALMEVFSPTPVCCPYMKSPPQDICCFPVGIFTPPNSFHAVSAHATSGPAGLASSASAQVCSPYYSSDQNRQLWHLF
jgi:hypothetical protein